MLPLPELKRIHKGVKQEVEQNEGDETFEENPQ